MLESIFGNCLPFLPGGHRPASTPEEIGNPYAVDVPDARGTGQTKSITMETDSSPASRVDTPDSDIDVELEDRLEQLETSCNEHEKLLLPGVVKPSTQPTICHGSLFFGMRHS